MSIAKFFRNRWRGNLFLELYTANITLVSMRIIKFKMFLIKTSNYLPSLTLEMVISNMRRLVKAWHVEFDFNSKNQNC